MPARSPQRSFQEGPPGGPPDPEQAQPPGRGSGDHPLRPASRQRAAEARKAEAEAGLVEDERQRCQAETRGVELKAKETEGRIRLQPLEAEDLRARIDREDAATLRDLTVVLSPWLIIALVTIVSAVNGGALVGSAAQGAWHARAHVLELPNLG